MESKAPHADCFRCPLKDAPCVHPTPKRARLALVGERPDKYEVEHQRYFAGPTGDLLFNRILPQAGLGASDISLHNAVCCAADFKHFTPAEWKKAIACCAPRLQADLKASQPQMVLAAGKRGLQALTGRTQVQSWIGAPLQGWAFEYRERRTKKGEEKVELVGIEPKAPGATADFSKYQVLPVFNPAWHFRGNNIDYLPVSRIHFERARLLIGGKLKPWQWPEMQIWPTTEALALLKKLQKAGRAGACISFDVESLGTDPWTAKLSCVGVGHRDLGAVSLCWDSYTAGKYGPQEGLEETKDPLALQCRALLLDILADTSIAKVAQNGQYDLLCLRGRGYEIQPQPFDTMMAHAVYAPALLHGLAFACATEFHAPRWKDEFHAGAGDIKGRDLWEKANPVELRTYNCKDNIMQSHLEGRCRERLKDTHRGQELYDNYRLVQDIADKMTSRGVRIDRARRLFHHRALRARMYRAAKTLKLIAKRMGVHHFNPDSKAHWNRLFFEKFHVKPTKFSAITQAPSLDESVLTPLVTHPNELVQIAAKAGLRFRRWATIDRSQVRRLRIDSAAVVHPYWKTTGTIGLRWSSSAPNAQNILQPIEVRLKSGRKRQIHGGLRNMYIPHEKGSYIVEADEKQLELRIIAALAGDKPLLDAFAAFDTGKGPDPHTVNAMDLFGVHGPTCTCGSAFDRRVTKRERTLVKNFTYNCNYGGDASSIHPVLSVDTPIEFTVVELLIERWFAKHPAIKRWQRKVYAEAREKGYVEEPFSGRRRHFWGHIKNTEVYNFPVQTLGGYILNQAIQKVDMALKWGSEGILFQVHDALVVEGPDWCRLYDLLQREMEVTLDIEGAKMRFPVDCKIGSRWGRLHDPSFLDTVTYACHKYKEIMKCTKRTSSLSSCSVSSVLA